jgi:FkbM family methyltransferase
MELDLANERRYWLGSYEPETQDFLRTHVAPGDVVYDVGAHVGFFSVCAARLGARVYAFEAAGPNADRARRQAELNALPIEVIEAAVWDSDRGVNLVEGDSSSEWHVVGGGRIDSVTLDEFAASHEPPALVKIDVEGAEGRVLRGAEGLLRQYRPTILCELHGEPARSEALSCLSAYEITEIGSPQRIAAFAKSPASVP